MGTYKINKTDLEEKLYSDTSTFSDGFQKLDTSYPRREIRIRY